MTSQTTSSFSDPYEPRPGLTCREADWSGLRVVVTGLGISGFAAADALSEQGAQVVVVDASDSGDRLMERAQILRVLDVDVRLGSEHVQTLPQGVDLVVTSPGWSPNQPLLSEAASRGVPIWGEVELAWRMRPREGAAPWVTLTGTNGKTTTVKMVTSILEAAGKRVVAAGNVGTPIMEAVLDPTPYDVIVVELSSFQLHWQRSLVPLASACLNVAADHVDWHGSFEDYARDKSRVYERTQVACVYNVDDPLTEQMVRDADVQEGCRAVGFTLGVPGLSMLGLVDDVLADRAFVAQRQTSAAELGTLDVLRSGLQAPAPHVVANALAAAALARACGASPLAVREGLASFRPEAHRIAEVATARGVGWIDDSKATNPHAAAASLSAYPSVVWIAGGLLKGADVDELVERSRDHLKAVLLIGRDRDRIRQALDRHAPHIPVVEFSETDTGVMGRVVARAAELAASGDVVLLAPAAASMDMFTDYGARGDAFAAAVRSLLSVDEG
ncbi:UDP-N-acetylmuramoylalanine--D-glutamate ligase [Austwickia chelonae]|uniref:UDP-N-acetylmuramoylalanine--D-glutamate ligase n=1 Tax=Austwickia chelonae NBRC 105200 TaxID=1184607 RepID=K6VM92_9MICO|nr:UDP-N-acetylmuramoyl-L-alanine--D-glutamate ligase [Austwickia chelonae]GAB76480.1 UDP-N-acetylmuramoylalanine--D-glutamate ligase [Austwickia chelonae NBRC 105200]SEW25446.1 UDP-N-acetylmuramoylalanine--D-glutamate ligase [Austwickia chelonae]